MTGHARRGLNDGLTAMLPLLLGIIPFGLILGVTAAGSRIGGVLGYLTSIIIFGGAAQLATVELIDQGAAAAVVVATGLVINSRHLMYSAALADAFQSFPRPWRIALPYLLTDQAFVLSVTHWKTETDPFYRRWYFLGLGIGLWVPWQLAVAVGVLVGASIPESWSLDFAVPLVFLALLTASLRDRPSVAAAAVGGVVAVVAAGMPWNLGLIVATASGIVAGVAARRPA
jgi:predicted branched-subunit amino acid permease